MQIWLEANISAHDFIPETYWRNNYAAVRSLIPQADVLVYETEAGVICGFVGVIANGYIAGLFVSGQFQRQGIGRQLMDICKQRYDKLMLDVYTQNERAYRFYIAQGFQVIAEKLNTDTHATEYTMQWRSHTTTTSDQ